MEWIWSKFTWFCSFLTVALLLLRHSRRKARNSSTSRRPPGPPGWPIIGNIFDLGTAPHQTLYSLRTKYGPILWLKLGSVNTMVIQSATAAAELFKNHDLPFSDRKVGDSLTAFDYDKGALALNAYGSYWRFLRRLYTAEFLSSKRVNESAGLRRKCVDKMVQSIDEEMASSRARGESGKVDVGRFLFLMTFDFIGNLVFSRDLLLDSNKSGEGDEFFSAMNGVMEWGGMPNLSDYFPLLKWLDPMGIKRNMVRDMGKTLKIIDRHVKERIQERQTRGGEKGKRDFLDVLLDYRGDGKEEPDKISQKNVTISILEMFFGGTETTSSTIEWAMTELLREPESMKKVKEELGRVVGTTRNVEESDFDQLPYLQAVVKETLRLHPAVPLLVPRNTMQDTNYLGYLVPKGTQVLVNAWAIGRDQDSWDDPLSFKPERFLGTNVEFKGQHFELIPFGSGRRICVGYTLGQRMIELGLATLLQSFDWELCSCDDINIQGIDMTERMGITLRKLVPLEAIPTRVTVCG